MKKSDINKIRIDIHSDEVSALSLLIDNQGNIKRQGNGTLPIKEEEVVGKTTSDVFANVLALVDEQVMPYANLYDHPNKAGTPLTVSVAFMSHEDDIKAFEFRLGTETPDVGELFPFFDNFIAQAISITQLWYDEEVSKSQH